MYNINSNTEENTYQAVSDKKAIRDAVKVNNSEIIIKLNIILFAYLHN